MNYGLVLTGGGARAAYQAGALQGLQEIRSKYGLSHTEFNILTGISAGAINACGLASKIQRPAEATESLWKLWSEIHSEQVMDTHVLSLGKIALKWLKDIVFGGGTQGGHSTHLIGTTPLLHLISENLSFDQIQKNIDSGILHGFSVSATNYKTGTAISFYDGHPSIEPWMRSSRLGTRTRITLQHVLASAAIPVLFPPVKIGACFYGDGSIRLSSPLSPAIHLGANKVIAIGVRHHRPEETTLELNLNAQMERVVMADLAGTLLNAAFLDKMDADVERMTRINQTLSLFTKEQLERHPSQLRKIPILSILPSKDLGSLAKNQFERFPGMLRFLLRGIGASPKKGSDLISYLAFDSSYTRILLELGLKDTLAREEEIRQFLESE